MATTPQAPGKTTAPEIEEPVSTFLGDDPNDPGQGQPFPSTTDDASGNEDTDADTTTDSTTEDDDKDKAPSEIEWGEGVEIPARLQGKTAEQVIHEWNSMQREFGRQSNELGEARSLLRDAVELNLGKTEQSTSEPKTPTSEDFEEDAMAATQRLIDKSLKPVMDALGKTDSNVQASQFERAFPNYQQDAATPEFEQFVLETPYRKNLYVKADKRDYDAAAELFTAYGEYKARKASAGAADENAVDAKTKQVREAGLESGGGKASGKGRGKVYRAADIQRLYNTDREKYNSMVSEFEKAYSEGRVK